MTPNAKGVPDRVLSEAVERLRELCAISSPSGDAAGIRAVASVVGSRLTAHGFSVEIAEEPDANGVSQPVLFARSRTSGGPHLLLLGHMDTVLPAIEPTSRDRMLFGTGALDMKGGLAMLLGALDLLAARGEQVPPDTLVVLVPDEEAESVISGAAANRWSRGARAVVVLEPGQATAGGETLVAGRRGLTEWKLLVRGRASHSGLSYWTGRSAVAAAADWCARAQGLSRPGTGPTVNVGRLVGGGSDFVGNLAAEHSMLGSSRQINVVSDRAVAEGEIRYLTAKDGDRMIEELQRLALEMATRHETEFLFTPGVSVPPVDPNGPGAPLIQRVVDLAAKRGLTLQVEEDRGGVSFTNFIADPATTPVIDGIGPTGEGMHVRGEYLSLDSLERRIALLADLLPTL